MFYRTADTRTSAIPLSLRSRPVLFRILYLLIFIFCLFFSTIGSTESSTTEVPILNIEDTNILYETRGYLEYWIAEEEKPIEQQLQDIDEANFQPFREVKLPARQKNVWFRMKLHNSLQGSLRNYLVFNDNIYDYISVFYRDSSGKWRGSTLGLLHPFNEREVNYRNFAFNNPTNANETIEIVFVINSLQKRLILPSIQPSRVFFEIAITDTIISTLMVGFVVGTLFYMVQLGGLRFHRQLTPLYFFLLVALLVMLYYGGFIFPLIPEQTTLHRNAIVLINGLLMFSGILLARSLFDFEKNIPWTRILVRLYLFVTIFVSIYAFIFGADDVINFTNFIIVPIGTLMMFMAGIYGVYRRKLYAFKFLAGITLYFFFMSAFTNKVLYVGNIRFDTHILEVSTCLLVMFLASTVISRINIERDRLKLAEHQAKVSMENSEAKSQFLAAMSHEIRTPMNGVLGMAQLLEQTKLDSVQRGYTQTILSTGKILLGIINDILDFTKIESGKLLLEKTNTNIDHILVSTATLFWQTAREKNISLNIYMTPGTPINVFSDPIRLQQVLNNLVSNAIKFTESGSISISLSVKERFNQSAIFQFSITDTGIGIPKNITEGLFDAYTQADVSTTRRFGGTGLGLAICKNLVTLMGGKIGVESEFGKGSTFWFNLPLEINQEKEALLNNELETLKGKRVALSFSYDYILRYYHQRLSAINAIPFVVNNIEDCKDADILLCTNVTWHSKSDVIAYYHRRNIPILRIVFQAGSETLSDSNDQVYTTSGNQALSDVFLFCTKVIHDQADSFYFSSSTVKDLSHLYALIAEDNPVNTQLVEAVLSRLNIKSDAVVNGKEALLAYQNDPQRYSIILMDCEMPEMDGFTASKEIRHFEVANSLNAVPIYALTANAIGDISQRCEEAGINKVLIKPLNLEEFIESLQQLA